MAFWWRSFANGLAVRLSRTEMPIWYAYVLALNYLPSSFHRRCSLFHSAQNSIIVALTQSAFSRASIVALPESAPFFFAVARRPPISALAGGRRPISATAAVEWRRQHVGRVLDGRHSTLSERCGRRRRRRWRTCDRRDAGTEWSQNTVSSELVTGLPELCAARTEPGRRTERTAVDSGRWTVDVGQWMTCERRSPSVDVTGAVTDKALSCARRKLCRLRHRSDGDKHGLSHQR